MFFLQLPGSCNALPTRCLPSFANRLAYAEMRLIMARILWNFDLELSKESDRWIEQEAYWTWHRPPLMMRLKAPPETKPL